MANQRSQTGRTFARHVAPFAPLALALAMSAAPPKQPATEASARTSSSHKAAACHPSLSSCPVFGCETEGSDHALVNEMKRRIPTSTSPKMLSWDDFRALQEDADSTVGEDQELDASDRARLHDLSISSGRVSEGDLVQLAGFLVGKPPPNTGESVNCGLSGSANNDFHIPFAADPDQTPFEGVVVEMIPQDRPAQWSIKSLNKIETGRREVLFTGQLFYDNMHRVNGDEENSQQGQPPRFSLFEIHPVTSIAICPSDHCDPSQPSQWRTLDEFLSEK
ncbi:MAG TPA: hypothetical protein VI386_23035 [Candidatus Sulfotelmatobacter sp.]